jgi:hypothetical protein
VTAGVHTLVLQNALTFCMRPKQLCNDKQLSLSVRVKCGETRSTHGTDEKYKQNLNGRPLGRHRRRWEDNIRMDLREIGWEDVNWIHLAQDRDQWRAVVNTVMNLRVP